MLEEIGVPYDVERVDLKAREQFAPTFRALNPKGKVPVLVRDDRSVLTDAVDSPEPCAVTNAIAVCRQAGGQYFDGRLHTIRTQRVRHLA